jgi:hypothetical protein
MPPAFQRFRLPPRRTGLLRLAAWCLLPALLALAGATRAAAPAEREVMAAYLYKFGAFVEWPASSFARPDSPLLIGISGRDELADQLERMVAGRSINGHALAVRKLRHGDSPAGLHIMFIGARDQDAVAQMTDAVRGQPVLTVSDNAGAQAGPAMVNFVVAGQRLRFEVALPQVAQGRLRISARMLAAALRVEGSS